MVSVAVGPIDRSRNLQYYADILGKDRNVMSVSRQNGTSPVSDGPSFVSMPKGDEERPPAARPPMQSVPVFAIPTLPPTTTSTQKTHADNGVVDNMLNGIRQIFGMRQPTCLNGGASTGNGKCKCPEFFEGKTCEVQSCLNGGNLTKTTVVPYTYVCQCPHPQYIDGAHCQTVKCANNAPLVIGNNSWHCDCTQRMFHSGKFCEDVNVPYAVLALPIAVFFVFLICCLLCRIDWCPRKQPRRNGRGHRSGGSNQRGDDGQRRTAATGRAPAERSMPPRSMARRPNPAQEFLLSHGNESRGQLAYPPSQGPPYVIRLDTIPTFNPNMIGGVEPPTAKPMEPPPSYDQALLAPSAPDPPRYTERADETVQPPPPNRQPPQPPT